MIYDITDFHTSSRLRKVVRSFREYILHPLVVEAAHFWSSAVVVGANNASKLGVHGEDDTNDDSDEKDAGNGDEEDAPPLKTRTAARSIIGNGERRGKGTRINVGRVGAKGAGALVLSDANSNSGGGTSFRAFATTGEIIIILNVEQRMRGYTTSGSKDG